MSVRGSFTRQPPPNTQTSNRCKCPNNHRDLDQIISNNNSIRSSKMWRFSYIRYCPFIHSFFIISSFVTLITMIWSIGLILANQTQSTTTTTTTNQPTTFSSSPSPSLMTTTTTTTTNGHPSSHDDPINESSSSPAFNLANSLASSESSFYASLAAPLASSADDATKMNLIEALLSRQRLLQQPNHHTCLYRGKRYKNNQQVPTEQPCLNCTCRRAVVQCFLRVCPPILSVEAQRKMLMANGETDQQVCRTIKEPNQCCPSVKCETVAVQSEGEKNNSNNSSGELENHSSMATSMADYSDSKLEDLISSSLASTGSTPLPPLRLPTTLTWFNPNANQQQQQVSSSSSSSNRLVVTKKDDQTIVVKMQGNGDGSSKQQQQQQQHQFMQQGPPYYTAESDPNNNNQIIVTTAPTSSYHHMQAPSGGSNDLSSDSSSIGFSTPPVGGSRGDSLLVITSNLAHTSGAQSSPASTNSLAHPNNNRLKSDAAIFDALVDMLNAGESSLSQLEDIDLKGACMINGSVYVEGSAVIPETNAFCQYCYCIRQKIMCIKPKCHLFISGCTPRYSNEYACCPTSYSCDSTPTNSLTRTTQTNSPNSASNLLGHHSALAILTNQLQMLANQTSISTSTTSTTPAPLTVRSAESMMKPGNNYNSTSKETADNGDSTGGSDGGDEEDDDDDDSSSGSTEANESPANNNNSNSTEIGTRNNSTSDNLATNKRTASSNAITSNNQRQSNQQATNGAVNNKNKKRQNGGNRNNGGAADKSFLEPMNKLGPMVTPISTCNENGRVYAVGEQIPTLENCRHCYCGTDGLKECRTIVCHLKEKHNCRPVIPEGHCCPIRYECPPNGSGSNPDSDPTSGSSSGGSGQRGQSTTQSMDHNVRRYRDETGGGGLTQPPLDEFGLPVVRTQSFGSNFEGAIQCKSNDGGDCLGQQHQVQDQQQRQTSVGVDSSLGTGTIYEVSADVDNVVGNNDATITTNTIGGSTTSSTLAPRGENEAIIGGGGSGGNGNSLRNTREEHNDQLLKTSLDDVEKQKHQQLLNYFLRDLKKNLTETTPFNVNDDEPKRDYHIAAPLISNNKEGVGRYNESIGVEYANEQKFPTSTTSSNESMDSPKSEHGQGQLMNNMDINTVIPSMGNHNGPSNTMANMISRSTESDGGSNQFSRGTMPVEGGFSARHFNPSSSSPSSPSSTIQPSLNIADMDSIDYLNMDPMTNSNLASNSAMNRLGNQAIPSTPLIGTNGLGGTGTGIGIGTGTTTSVSGLVDFDDESHGVAYRTTTTSTGAGTAGISSRIMSSSSSPTTIDNNNNQTRVESDSFSNESSPSGGANMRSAVNSLIATGGDLGVTEPPTTPGQPTTGTPIGVEAERPISTTESTGGWLQSMTGIFKSFGQRMNPVSRLASSSSSISQQQHQQQVLGLNQKPLSNGPSVFDNFLNSLVSSTNKRTNTNFNGNGNGALADRIGTSQSERIESQTTQMDQSNSKNIDESTTTKRILIAQSEDEAAMPTTSQQQQQMVQASSTLAPDNTKTFMHRSELNYNQEMDDNSQREARDTSSAVAINMTPLVASQPSLTSKIIFSPYDPAIEQQSATNRGAQAELVTAVAPADSDIFNGDGGSRNKKESITTLSSSNQDDNHRQTGAKSVTLPSTSATTKSGGFMQRFGMLLPGAAPINGDEILEEDRDTSRDQAPIQQPMLQSVANQQQQQPVAVDSITEPLKDSHHINRGALDKNEQPDPMEASPSSPKGEATTNEHMTPNNGQESRSATGDPALEHSNEVSGATAIGVAGHHQSSASSTGGSETGGGEGSSLSSINVGSAGNSNHVCVSFDGKRLYQQNEKIDKQDPCLNCFCFFGEERCQTLICPPKPTNQEHQSAINCVAQRQEGKCCPEYTCSTGSGVNHQQTIPLPIVAVSLNSSSSSSSVTTNPIDPLATTTTTEIPILISTSSSTSSPNSKIVPTANNEQSNIDENSLATDEDDTHNMHQPTIQHQTMKQQQPGQIHFPGQLVHHQTMPSSSGNNNNMNEFDATIGLHQQQQPRQIIKPHHKQQQQQQQYQPNSNQPTKQQPSLSTPIMTHSVAPASTNKDQEQRQALPGQRLNQLPLVPQTLSNGLPMAQPMRVSDFIAATQKLSPMMTGHHNYQINHQPSPLISQTTNQQMNQQQQQPTNAHQLYFPPPKDSLPSYLRFRPNQNLNTLNNPSHHQLQNQNQHQSQNQQQQLQPQQNHYHIPNIQNNNYTPMVNHPHHFQQHQQIYHQKQQQQQQPIGHNLQVSSLSHIQQHVPSLYQRQSTNDLMTLLINRPLVPINNVAMNQQQQQQPFSGNGNGKNNNNGLPALPHSLSAANSMIAKNGWSPRLPTGPSTGVDLSPIQATDTQFHSSMQQPTTSQLKQQVGAHDGDRQGFKPMQPPVIIANQATSTTTSSASHHPINVNHHQRISSSTSSTSNGLHELPPPTAMSKPLTPQTTKNHLSHHHLLSPSSSGPQSSQLIPVIVDPPQDLLKMPIIVANHDNEDPLTNHHHHQQQQHHHQQQRQENRHQEHRISSASHMNHDGVAFENPPPRPTTNNQYEATSETPKLVEAISSSNQQVPLSVVKSDQQQTDRSQNENSLTTVAANSEHFTPSQDATTTSTLATSQSSLTIHPHSISVSSTTNFNDNENNNNNNDDADNNNKLVSSSDTATSINPTITTSLNLVTTVVSPSSTDTPIDMARISREESTPSPSTITSTTTTTTTSTTAAPKIDETPYDPLGILNISGCNIYGRLYEVGQTIDELSSKCKKCICNNVGVDCQSLC